MDKDKTRLYRRPIYPEYAMKSNAFIAGDYRYCLSRSWDSGLTATWIMLNPSTADASVDDPTIRRLLGFCKSFGFGSFHVVNLFALRSTDPKALKTHPDPIGPENDTWILDRVGLADLIICAWGSHGSLNKRDAQVLQILKGHRLTCLGTTMSGSPRHPLYLKSSCVPLPFNT